MANIRLKISGDRQGRREVVLYCPGKYVIGRDDKCEVVLGDSMVSKRHAQIDLTISGARLRDLHSTNGTRVGGHWLGSRAADQGLEHATPIIPQEERFSGTIVRKPDDDMPLENGAEIEIGSTQILVYYDILPGDMDVLERYFSDAKEKIGEADRLIQTVLEMEPNNERANHFKRIIQALDYHL